MNIFLAISHFSPIGGSEEPLAVLAIELNRLGHNAHVFSMLPVKEDNQYVKRLRQHGIHVSACPRWKVWFAKFIGDWYFRDKIVRVLAWLISPFISIVALAVAAYRRVSFQSAWRSVFGRTRAQIGQYLLKDPIRDGLLERMKKTYASTGADLIHIFRPDLHFVLPWAETKHIPSVYYELVQPSLQTKETPDFSVELLKNLNKATIVTAISKATANGLREVGIKRPISLIYPVLTDVPTLPDNRPAVSERPVTITFIARLAPEKGISDLLSAAKILLNAHPDLQFLIAGDGPLKEELIQQARELKIDAKVRFYGLFPRVDLPIIMNMTDIFVLPSYLEGMPFAIIEAMAYAKPVVATRVAGVPEVVVDEVSGFVCEPYHPDVLAERLMRLVENEDLRVKMGMAGRKVIQQGKFSLREYISSTIRVYQEALHLCSETDPVSTSELS